MRKLSVFLVLSLLIFAVGCTTVQKGAATGAAAGGVLGAIIGHQSGHAVGGAAIGAATGAAAGALIGEKLDKKFCPECGRRFGSSVNVCPYDGAELKNIE